MGGNNQIHQIVAQAVLLLKIKMICNQQLRYVPPTNKRCGLLYLEQERFDKHCNQVKSDLHRTLGYFTNVPFSTEGQAFPANTIVLPELSKFANKLERLKYGRTCAHEFAHSRGLLKEWDARCVDREYLRRNGLSGPTDREMVRELNEPTYKKNGAFGAAVVRVYGEPENIWQELKIIFSVFFGRKYCIERDLKKAAEQSARAEKASQMMQEI
jgi:hypothetical protein